MIVLLGTTSEQKIDIVKNVLREKHIDAEVKPLSVASDIPEQPFGEEVITKGSINRAQNAIRKIDSCDFSVGLEGGICIIDNALYYICVASIVGTDGKVYTGVGEKVLIPKQLIERLQDGEYFATLIREFEETVKNEGEDLRSVVHELVYRTQGFSKALENALDEYERSH